MSRPALKAYIAPFAVFMLFLALNELVHTLFKNGPPILATPQYWIYPLQTVVCAILIWRFWPAYSFSRPVKAAFAILIGALVLMIWISPQVLFHFPRRESGFDPSVFANNQTLYLAEVALRFARLVIIVPLLEEIFWRGFLLRYLIREDFENVSPGTFSWLSFLGVTGCFGLAHFGPDLIPALLTGALYNLVMYKTRSLSACVLAHAVTNFGLGIYIMVTRQWGFW